MQTAYDEATRIRRSGFIAQEVEQAANATGYDFSGIIKPKTDQDHYSLSYDAFVVPLVKAVQEEHLIIAEQAKKINEQEKKIAALEQQDQQITSLQQQLSELRTLIFNLTKNPDTKKGDNTDFRD
jgi:3-methyladenine DNA glycosylase Tag